MLDIAVQYHTAIDKLTANRKFALHNYEMSMEDWKMAAQLCKVLQVFKNVTMAFLKADSNIAKVLPAMDKICDILETNSTSSNFSPAIKSALATGTKLLNHYHALADCSLVYRFTTILHPSYKLEYFKNADWPDDWIEDAKESIQEEYTRVYTEMDVKTPASSQAHPVSCSISYLVPFVLTFFLGFY
ncbi:hypothetical protein BC827DRAFT_1133378 [Russula dissimulans]|nr:hypothetical protein BC827DRAFT_1133378 [Russula dissimulans]